MLTNHDKDNLLLQSRCCLKYCISQLYLCLECIHQRLKENHRSVPKKSNNDHNLNLRDFGKPKHRN